MNQFAIAKSMTLAALLSVGALVIGPTAASAALPKAAVVASYDDLAPFSQRLDIILTNGFGSGTFTVPAGQRLVIDYISADIGVAVGGTVLFDVATYLNGNEVEAHLPVVPNGVVLGQQVYSVSQMTRIYADSGSLVTIAILGPTGGGGGSIVGVYGHFIPLP